jgi:hypothetical protein
MVPGYLHMYSSIEVATTASLSNDLSLATWQPSFPEGCLILKKRRESWIA